MVTSEMADMIISGVVSAPAGAQGIFRSRRSSGAPRRSRRGESRLHARGALRTQPRQDAELQAADHGALAVLGNDEEDIRIACEPIERRKIGLRQRVFDPLTGAAERIVRQHGDDDADILAAGTTDGDL